MVCPFETSRTRQAGPLPPQGWRLNSKKCVHCPLPAPTRIHKKRIGTKTGAVGHAVARSSVERALRCVRIMHLVCCVGESVCATLHLLDVLPCRVAAGDVTPAVRHQKETRHAFASQALQRDVSRATKKIDRGFCSVDHTIEATLSERFGG